MKKPQLIASIITAFIILSFAPSVKAESYVCQYECWGGDKMCLFRAKREKDTFVGQTGVGGSLYPPETPSYKVDEGKDFIVLSKISVRPNAHANVVIINKKTLSFIISSTSIVGDFSSKYKLDGKIDEGSSSSKKGRCRMED
jgi:hypothetical protein